MTMGVKIGTFNAENLFLRYKFLATERGSMGKKVDPSEFIKEGGHINMLGFEILDDGQRKNTARVILENDPDVICLQEVENLETLKQFNSKYLKRKYPYAMLVDGNDLRQIDVGILSKLEIGGVQTHQFDKDMKGVIFSRDCLGADIFLDKKGNKRLTLFVNHLKSRLGGVGKTAEKRERQSTRIAGIIQEHFGNDVENANFIVLGDFNDSPDAECLKPLLGEPWVENVVARLPKNEQWTHYWESKHETNQFDYILLSKVLSEKNPDILPQIERRGLADYAKAYKGPRFPGVGPKGTEASDHCPVFMEIDV
jgi:endonuclease/exonuclease/phosphatase family metal-dependent hydrolase